MPCPGPGRTLQWHRNERTEMRDYSTKTARGEFVANWYRTVESWQRDLRKVRP